MRTKQYKAYSLIEIVIVIGVMASVSVFLFPLAISQISTERLKSESIKLESAIYSQRQRASNSDVGSSGGVIFYTNSYSIFDGASFDTSTAQIDYELPNGITFSTIDLQGGGNEVLFISGNFRTNNYGVVELTDGEDIVSVIINSEGLIEIVD